MLQSLGEQKVGTLPGLRKTARFVSRDGKSWNHRLAVLDGALEIPWSVPYFSGESETQKGSDLPKATWLTEQS